MIEVKNVHKKFDRNEVLKGVTLKDPAVPEKLRFFVQSIFWTGRMQEN